MISRGYRALDWPCSMYGTNVMAQKPQFTPKSENCRKCIESPTGGISASETLPLEHARELFEPSKDSWSLLVCTEKKTWDLSSWFSMGLARKRGFAFFDYSFMTSSPEQWAKIVAQSLVVFLAGIWIFRALDGFPSVSGTEVMAIKLQIIVDMPQWFQGIFLINLCLFCHNLWTRNARKSIKPCKDSYCGLESRKTLNHKIGRIVRLPGDDVIIQM